jgi:hypothetical protein
MCGSTNRRRGATSSPRTGTCLQPCTRSKHGEHAGPSSAGAMQFLPSTWKRYAVGGNGDGTPNMMETPETQIPAAAYLKVGEAPENWYAALYANDRAGRYVRRVSGIAEGYRRLADGWRSGVLRLGFTARRSVIGGAPEEEPHGFCAPCPRNTEQASSSDGRRRATLGEGVWVTEGSYGEPGFSL